MSYAVPGAEGMQLRFLDLSTGIDREGFVIEKGKGVDAAVSPDGQIIAFSDLVPGSMAYGLYVANVDGSDRRLIAQLEHWGIGDPVWSPDHEWLIVTIINVDQFHPVATPALIDLETCEAFPLVGIEGHVQGWTP